MTKGLSLNRSSFKALGISNMPSPRMACPQNEISLGVSVAVKPTLLLNHWRVSSRSVMIAIGVLQISDARLVSSSKLCSGKESRILRLLRSSSRLTSFCGRLGVFKSLGFLCS